MEDTSFTPYPSIYPVQLILVLVAELSFEYITTDVGEEAAYTFPHIIQDKITAPAIAFTALFFNNIITNSPFLFL